MCFERLLPRPAAASQVVTIPEALEPAPKQKARARSQRPRRSANLASFRFLFFIGIFLLRFVNIGDASGTGDLIEGHLDPRGFKPLYIDSATGTPIRFNPCDPIHYIINPASAPAGGVEDAHRAFEVTAEATGMTFIYDGTTAETYRPDRESYQPDAYGDRWAPILISWSEEPLNVDGTISSGRKAIGLGGSAFTRNEDGRLVYVTGTAVFDAKYDLNSGFGGATWGQVMLHELGHIMGLAHLEDKSSVMNPGELFRPAIFGEGDRAGLWELGVGSSCIKVPELP